MENTKIQWTTHTFNPWIGCTKIAPGCTHCYAAADMADRRGRVVWGPHGTRSRTSDAYWKNPIKWNLDAWKSCERTRVFCASLSDVFEDWDGEIVDSHGRKIYVAPSGKYCNGLGSPTTDDGWRKLSMSDVRCDLFNLIEKTPNLDWLLLTKRPQNIRRMWPKHGQKLGNVWLGTSISEQDSADESIHHLLECRGLAPVLFLSAEPLLGPIDLRYVQVEGMCEINCLDGTCGVILPHRGKCSKIDWIIVGAESGRNRRPMNQEWAESIVDQCQSSGVACFVKQMEIDGKVTGDIEKFPEHLRVRQFPIVA